MPKNELSKQKSKKSLVFYLFGCMNAQKEEKTEIEISIKELQLIDEIISNLSRIKNVKLKGYEERNSLPLPLMQAIKKTSEKPNKSFDEMQVLKGMITMYEEYKKKNEFLESELNKNTLVTPIIASASLTFDQNFHEEKSALLQHLQDFEFNSDRQSQQKNNLISPKLERGNTSNIKRITSMMDLSGINDNSLPTVSTLPQTCNDFSRAGEDLLCVLKSFLTSQEQESDYVFEIQEKICSNQLNKEELQELSTYARKKMTTTEFFKRNKVLSVIPEGSDLAEIDEMSAYKIFK